MQNFICVQLHPIHMKFSTLDPDLTFYLAYTPTPMHENWTLLPSTILPKCQFKKSRNVKALVGGLG